MPPTRMGQELTNIVSVFRSTKNGGNRNLRHDSGGQHCQSEKESANRDHCESFAQNTSIELAAGLFGLVNMSVLKALLFVGVSMLSRSEHTNVSAIEVRKIHKHDEKCEQKLSCSVENFSVPCVTYMYTVS
jgi:hypothetical protein